tara:strand:- start:308 stop:829 length:522 start_codon:yes stop_codon:yes gene_type:complete
MQGVIVAREVMINEVLDPGLEEIESNASFINTELSHEISRAYYLSYVLKSLQYISFPLSLIYCGTNFLFLLPLFFEIFGLLGRWHYNKKFLIIYLIYITGITFIRDYFFFFNYFLIDLEKKNDLSIELFIIFISTIVNLCISIKIIKFIHIIVRLDPITIERIVNNQINIIYI